MNADILNRGTEDPPPPLSLSLSLFFLFFSGSVTDMPPPLPYFKVNVCPFTLPHFASIFFAYL